MRKDIGFAEKAIAVNVSSGDQDFANGFRALFVGGAGNIAVTMKGGGDVTFTGVTAGLILPISASVIKQTGTTATNVVALL